MPYTTPQQTPQRLQQTLASKPKTAESRHKTIVSRQRNSFFKNKASSNTLNSLIDKYMFYLKYEKNVSPKTLENYSLRLSRLVDFL